MYPNGNESETYATAPSYGYPPQDYELQAAGPAYNGTPQPQPQQPYYAPPYINTSTRVSDIRTRQWSSGLCHCLDDPANCVVTCFCPCITFGQIAEIIDKGNSTCTCKGSIYGTLLALTGLSCLYSCYYRSKMRAQYELPEAPCMDCLVHFCCETCALCHEYRELKSLGYDMSIGWEANMERSQRQGATIGAPIPPAMTMTR